MSIYSCKSCDVHFDSKSWYDGHIRRAHGAPAKLEISSTTSIPNEHSAAPSPRRRHWHRRFKTLFLRKTAA